MEKNLSKSSSSVSCESPDRDCPITILLCGQRNHRLNIAGEIQSHGGGGHSLELLPELFLLVISFEG
jgi:hypothetical protein